MIKNYSTAVMLVNSNIRAMYTVYEPLKENPGQKRTMFKTLDPDLKVGDLVLVPSGTRFGFNVNEIIEADVKVDYESSNQVLWIASKIELSDYNNNIAMEAEMTDALRDSEEHRKREEIKASMFAAMDAGVLQGLKIAQIAPPAKKE
jgi:bacterioferritin (cytochrome b1)